MDLLKLLRKKVFKFMDKADGLLCFKIAKRIVSQILKVITNGEVIA